MDLDRLRYLAAEGDTQAAAELARQEQRRGSVITPLLTRLRDAHERSDDDKARALVFGLYRAGYDQLRWRMMGVEGIYYRTETVPLITGKRGAPDHFKAHRNYAQRAVAFPGPCGLLLLPLIWDQAALDKARAEMATHALYYGRQVARWLSTPANASMDGGLTDLAVLYLTNPQHPLLESSTAAHVRELARRLRATHGIACPGKDPPRLAASILAAVFEAQDPDATLDHLRATVTAARVYTRRLLDGITEGEGIATRRDLARMLAAIYCGQDHTITPRD